MVAHRLFVPPGSCQVHEPGIYLLDDRQLRKVVDHREREIMTHEAAEVGDLARGRLVGQ